MQTTQREELLGPGVYFLFCKEEDGTDSVYIGEAEKVQERLIQHLRDYQSEKEKYYWTTAVIFVGRDLNKAHIRYLGNRFVEIAKECKRYSILTKNTYKNTGSVKAKGLITTEGFVVLAGSDVNEKVSEKSLSLGAAKQRENLFREGKVENLKTIEDILFSSSLAAADFLLGYSVSGPRTWKNNRGIPLKELDD